MRGGQPATGAGTARRRARCRPTLRPRARIDLDRAGAGGDAAAEPIASGLTDREREVLTLLTAGRTNGQIATALFTIPKTASVRVSNILAKLGVSGRIEAAAVAHRLGLV